jgi:ATP-dependent helicase HrpB
VSGEHLLAMLEALTGESDGRLTPLGKQLVALPLHPRLARLLLATADAGMIEDGAALAALLSEKDIVAFEDFASRRAGPKVQGSSDLLVRLDLLHEAERDRFGRHLLDRGIDSVAARQVARTRDELYRIASRVSGVRRGSGGGSGAARAGRDDDVLLKALLAAYPDRVCRRRASDPSAGVMVGGGGVRLARESVVWQSEFFLALDARRDPRSPTREALVRIASGIDVAWLEELFPQSIRREREAIFDEQRQRVVGRGATYYRDLPLREDKDAAVDADTAGHMLGEWARPRAMQLLRSDDSVQRWLARFDLLRRAMPEHPWPALDAAWAADTIAAAAQGRRSLADLRLQLPNIVHGLLPYPLDRLFDREAPETIEVPTGNRIRVDYPPQSDGAPDVDPPVLAVRLQELFGWTDTPRVAGGRVPVKLHLLGPNYRPVQVTSDLRSFWSTTYFQVRKDLKARYPKHSWPEDPLAARPEAKGGRRRSAP